MKTTLKVSMNIKRKGLVRLAKQSFRLKTNWITIPKTATMNLTFQADFGKGFNTTTHLWASQFANRLSSSPNHFYLLGSGKSQRSSPHPSFIGQNSFGKLPPPLIQLADSLVSNCHLQLIVNQAITPGSFRHRTCRWKSYFHWSNFGPLLCQSLQRKTTFSPLTTWKWCVAGTSSHCNTLMRKTECRKVRWPMPCCVIFN